MLGLERAIRDYSSSVIVAEGDMNTVLAAALVSVKCLTPFAHVEAGLRSWNMVMPEEVNRRVADAVASLHFAPTNWATPNLLFEGVPSRTVHVTGNTIVDSLQQIMGRVSDRSDSILNEYGLDKDDFILATLHRAENTNNP